MIKLIDILLEEYPKGKYIPLEGEELNKAKQDLFDLIQNAYKSIGGHLKMNSPDDVLDPDTNFWRAADIDEDPELDVVYFGKITPIGIKHTGIGHDGRSSNIKNLLIRKSKELGEPGNYVEVSGAAFNSFVKRGGVPIIDDEEKVRAVLSGKEIEWHGEHPEGKHEGSGWYTRSIGGTKITKTLVGNI
tara:strand:+ start:1234 stop:1797 length:564 start_codon:yes stop_codon:yes gene_type:complete